MKRKNNTEWSRKCSRCDNILFYSVKYSRDNAERNKTKCRECYSSDRKGTSFTWTEEQKKRFSKTRKKYLQENPFTEEHRKNMSAAKKGRKLTKEWKSKIKKNNSKYWLGKKRSPETIEKISKSRIKQGSPWLIGQKFSDERKRKMRISRIAYMNSCSDTQISPTYNKDSIPILENKAKELGITDLQHAENGGEYHIKELGYWVDGYSKEKNIVLEYYERAHKSQIEKDIRRKQEIINHLGCEFYEIWYDDIQ
tara:strand:+ start:73 stop:831 length:759 start_codon:yes stop_codon:yes gene_type:complete